MDIMFSAEYARPQADLDAARNFIHANETVITQALLGKLWSDAGFGWFS